MPNTALFKVTFVIFEETKSKRNKVQKNTRTFIGNIELCLKDFYIFQRHSLVGWMSGQYATYVFLF